MKRTRQHRILCGFTLMETLLAIALVSLLVSIFLTVFVPSRGLIQQALTKQESDRLVSVLNAEINTIRPNERAQGGSTQAAASPDQYNTTFDKGFYWLLKSTNPDKSIVIFSYRADTTQPMNADGTYPAIPPNTAKPGKDSIITTIACPMDSHIHRKNIPHAVGPVFLVKLTQIEQHNNGTFELSGSPGSIINAGTPEKYFSSENSSWQWGGAIFCRADFYLMYPPNPARYKNRSWSRVGRPIFSANFSFRR